MSRKSNIEWTDHTWNPIVGCSTDHILTQPLRWRKPKRIFVNSMGDLFHEDVPDEWIDKVFAVMALAPQHTFQVLTKRADRMREYITDAKMQRRIDVAMVNLLADAPIARLPTPITDANYKWPLPQVWLGISAERQQEADERIPHLLQTPAAVRFVSAEPLLGPIDLTSVWYSEHRSLNALTGWKGFDDSGARMHCSALNWIIVGGEGGPRARPMHPDWARSLRDQCETAGAAFFFKQWGEWIDFHAAPIDARLKTDIDAVPYGEWHDDTGFVASCLCGAGHGSVIRVGKKAAGRLLDGREHNGMPQVRA